VRFVRAQTDSGPRVGVLRADDTVALSDEVSRLEPYFGDDGQRLHELGAAVLAGPGEQRTLGECALLAPVRPPSMRDFMVFEEHVKPSWQRAGLTRGPDVWYEQPIGYFSNAANLLGPRDGIEIPGGSARLDFELEVGAIVGRELRSVSPDQVAGTAGSIAGFLILCDWSARDLQAREMEGRLGPFKGKDFGSSLGPVFVTPDELADRRDHGRGTGYELLMISAVNGREYGRDRWSSAYWSFEELLSYASWNSAVEPGALIGSGTCQGGCILELSNRHGSEQYPWLAAGDEVRLSIERMGEIVAPVRASARGGWPGAKTVSRP
jgi:2-keto-4-pentenoate hydratase/2-oxohepta-3-ene-1,7-dioic acid hydratase in catechol pathway